MALKTRASIIDMGEILKRKASEFTFQDPPLIDAPHTQITNLDGSARQLPDPSKTLKPVFGNERVHNIAPVLVEGEKGPNGEKVFSNQDGDPRIRFIGDWRSSNSGYGSRVTTPTDGQKAEITFYGTGLNMLYTGGITSRDLRISVDGGSQGSNLVPSSTSDILGNRNYRSNGILPLVSGLTLDVHTVEIEYVTAVGSGEVTGIEIINEDTQIQVPQGEIFHGGLKYRHSSLEALNYDSDFDGAPVLNGRGGRVVPYITPEGRLGKVIQQVDNSAVYLGAADHTNEEVIRKINFREFGANRGDDFSTLSSTSDRAFTLEDGVTTLVGDNVAVSTEGVYADTSGFLVLTFVGTGLDLVWTGAAATETATKQVFIDGVEITAGAQLLGVDGELTSTVVSGLPYGTHNIRITRASAGAWNSIRDFIIYGPKKPDVPEDALELPEYYLMADYVANSVANEETIGQGLLRKHAAREMEYVGTWASLTLDATDIGGMFTSSGTASSTVKFSFWGTGFELRFWCSGGALNHTMSVNGSTDQSGFTTSSYGGGTYTPAAGTISNTGWRTAGENGISVSGLTLGFHEVEVEVGGATFFFSAFEVITPVHYPNTKIGSLSLGPAVRLGASPKNSSVDFREPKAWLNFNQTDTQVVDSYNIAAVIDAGTGIFEIYFEKPFKQTPIVAASNGAEGTRILSVVSGNVNTPAGASAIQIRSINNAGTAVDSTYNGIVCFGELIDEDDE